MSRLFPMTRSRKLVKGSVHESGSIRLWTRESPGSFRGEDERPSDVAGVGGFSRSHRPFGVVEGGSRIEAQLDRHLSCPDLGDRYLWAFVDGRPILNAPRSLKDLPAETALSRALSKDLVKRGFRFVGPKICYAFMQSVGLVNDHIIGCFRRDLNERSGTN